MDIICREARFLSLIQPLGGTEVFYAAKTDHSAGSKENVVVPVL